MTTELDFLAEDANTTDQSTVHIAGNAYPFIQWIGGDSDQDKAANVRYHGGFFVPKSQLDLTGVPGWAAGYIKRKDADGKKVDVEGFYAADLNIAVIAQRHRYEVSTGDGRPELFSAKAYDAADTRAKELSKTVGKAISPKKKSQFLVIIKGMEDRPVSLTLKGVFAKAMSGQSGLLQAFDRTFMKAVADELRKQGTSNLLPMRRFWVHVGIAKNTKGDVEFTTVGPKGNTSDVVLPTLWGMPNPVTPTFIKDSHVGQANKAPFDQLYTDAQEWAKAWDNGGKAAATEQAATEAAAPQVDSETAAALAAM